MTNGLQSGSSTAEIAASTKHKSVETLAGYAQKTDHIMGATGLSIATRANELTSGVFFQPVAGIERTD